MNKYMKYLTGGFFLLLFSRLFVLLLQQRTPVSLALPTIIIVIVDVHLSFNGETMQRDFLVVILEGDEEEKKISERINSSSHPLRLHSPSDSMKTINLTKRSISLLFSFHLMTIVTIALQLNEETISPDDNRTVHFDRFSFFSIDHIEIFDIKHLISIIHGKQCQLISNRQVFILENPHDFYLKYSD